MKKEFDYKLKVQGKMAVVNFSGTISHDPKERLDTCLKEVICSEAKIYFLLFNDVQAVEASALRELALIQQELRKKKCELWLVGIERELKKYLLDKGIIRLHELKSSLNDFVRA